MSLCVHAQGWIRSAGNSASYDKGIAQGSIFVIFGGQLGPDQLVQAPAYPLGTELAQTSVRVTVGGTTLACPMVYTSSRQVAAIMPSAMPAGEGTVSVGYQGQWTWPVPVTVLRTGFGIYTTAATGSGPGSITGTDYALNTFAHPAKPRDVLVLWGTGLGPVPGDDGSGPQPGVQFDGVSVYIGNRPAKLIYAGRSGGYAALDQVNAEVPDGVPEGCFVPVAVHSGSHVSNYVTIAVSSSRKGCTNTSGIPAEILASAAAGAPVRAGMIALGPMGVLQGGGFQFTLLAAQRIGAILGVQVAEADVAQVVKAARARNRKAVGQILAKYNIPPGAVTPSLIQRIRKAVFMDRLAAAAVFGTYSNLGIAAPELGALSPASGTCAVLKMPPSGAGAKGRGLDAGPTLTLNGPLGSHVLTRYTNGEYQVDLGTGFGSTLPPGTYQITGSGGSDIPPFTAQFPVTTSVVWTNKVSAIDRAQPLTVTWSGGPDSGHLLIGGWSHSEGTGAAFACVEEAGKGSFTFPAHVLSALPPTGSTGSHIFIGQHPLDNPISIPGLDMAYIASAGSDHGQVTFR